MTSPSVLKSLSPSGTSPDPGQPCLLEVPPSNFSERNGILSYVVPGSTSDVNPGVRTLRRGKHRLFLWAGREADGSDDSATPSKLGTRDEMGRLEKVRAHSRYCLGPDRPR